MDTATYRQGPFIETVSGKCFYFLDPQPDDITIEDIAHALSMECRFGGHCRSFWSVAAHSLLVAQLLPAKFQLAGLLHDASEAYLKDIPSPLKKLLPDYREIEANVAAVIEIKFGVKFCQPEIKQADVMALMTEKRDLFKDNSGVDWKIDASAAPFHIVPVNIELTRTAFLKEFYYLYDKRKIESK